MGELVTRSEAELGDIRNFGQKSIDEVKAKLIEFGLALKDSPPGFDPSSIVRDYADDEDEDEIAVDVDPFVDAEPETEEL